MNDEIGWWYLQGNLEVYSPASSFIDKAVLGRAYFISAVIGSTFMGLVMSISLSLIGYITQSRKAKMAPFWRIDRLASITHNA